MNIQNSLFFWWSNVDSMGLISALQLFLLLVLMDKLGQIERRSLKTLDEIRELLKASNITPQGSIQPLILQTLHEILQALRERR